MLRVLTSVITRTTPA